MAVRSRLLGRRVWASAFSVSTWPRFSDLLVLHGPAITRLDAKSSTAATWERRLGPDRHAQRCRHGIAPGPFAGAFQQAHASRADSARPVSQRCRSSAKVRSRHSALLAACQRLQADGLRSRVTAGSACGRVERSRERVEITAATDAEGRLATEQLVEHGTQAVLVAGRPRPRPSTDRPARGPCRPACPAVFRRASACLRSSPVCQAEVHQQLAWSCRSSMMLAG